MTSTVIGVGICAQVAPGALKESTETSSLTKMKPNERLLAVAPDRSISAPDDVVPVPTRSGVRTAALP